MDLILLLKFGLSMSSGLFLSLAAIFLFLGFFVKIVGKLFSKKTVKKQHQNKYYKKYRHYFYGFMILSYLLFPMIMFFSGASNTIVNLSDLVLLTIVMVLSAIFYCYGLLDILNKLLYETNLDEMEQKISRQSMRNAMLGLIFVLGTLYFANSIIQLLFNYSFDLSQSIDSLTIINIVFFTISIIWVVSYLYYIKIKSLKDV
ncbi:hypothetical protein KO465_01550 [Candidatus Micrarchaeota archaeon]|nr:hypothetical protein [Candidatus Micrarchaeota archaeon]